MSHATLDVTFTLGNALFFQFFCSFSYWFVSFSCLTTGESVSAVSLFAKESSTESLPVTGVLAGITSSLDHLQCRSNDADHMVGALCSTARRTLDFVSARACLAERGSLQMKILSASLYSYQMLTGHLTVGYFVSQRLCSETQFVAEMINRLFSERLCGFSTQ